MKFAIPFKVNEYIPNDYKIDLKTYLIMEYVAKSVSKEGSPFEFRLKIHPQSHKLPFLDSNHKLHICYRFLEKNPEYHLYHYRKNHVPEMLSGLYERIFIMESKGIEEKSLNQSVIEGYSDSD